MCIGSGWCGFSWKGWGCPKIDCMHIAVVVPHVPIAKVLCLLCRIFFIVLSVMEDDIEVVIHHRRKLVNEGCLKYEGESDTMYFDPDLWSYFVVVSVVKGLGYDEFKDLWFSVGCGLVLDDKLEALCDDVGAMHMVNLARLNGQVHLYVVHTVSELEVIQMIEYNVDEGEVDEGHDVEANDVEETIVIEGAHDERTKLNDVEGETMELDEAHDERIEVEELEDIEVEVREWSTSDDNGEVNSMDGLVDINIQCDFRESDNYGNMEVDGSALPESDLEEDDISDTSLFNEEDDVSALPASVVILCYIGSL
ncbi:uncharacterized protein HKW66_Vig0154130 [Vigna angularis]|uniref:PB1-like domain-containing protein n=1 Tax=Phaseolus angularis TaxID=3914 RepID=A0A8T0JND9_PHAAN|nr:uncharacterized protein HKW66_Vig0154130 [Vigna angularis]